MSGFSSLLDISSFFIGVLVNLLLVAMICFYFKRKIDNLELSQSEQAKILFQLLQQGPPQGGGGGISSGLPDKHAETFHLLNGLDLSQLNSDPEQELNEEKGDENSVVSDDSDDDSDDSDDESVDETKTIEYEEVVPVENIEKLTIKEIRSLLEENGVSDIKRSAKKQELIDMYMGVMTQKEEVIEQVVKVESNNDVDSSEREDSEEDSEEVNEDSEEVNEEDSEAIHEVHNVIEDIVEDIVEDITIGETVSVIEINSEITDIS
tara:strand:+ start:116 stop:907 length:792 start_codon:yes stop_codon:yes gene_type:complete